MVKRFHLLNLTDVCLGMLALTTSVFCAFNIFNILKNRPKGIYIAFHFIHVQGEIIPLVYLQQSKRRTLDFKYFK